MAYDKDVAERIRAIAHRRHDVTEKKMFGGMAFLIGGHMAVAASGQGGIMLHVNPHDVKTLLTDPAVRPVEMRGRIMTGWLRVETAGLSDAAFTHWVDRGIAYAAALPPK